MCGPAPTAASVVAALLHAPTTSDRDPTDGFEAHSVRTSTNGRLRRSHLAQRSVSRCADPPRPPPPSLLRSCTPRPPATVTRPMVSRLTPFAPQPTVGYAVRTSPNGRSADVRTRPDRRLRRCCALARPDHQRP